jgi:hypothetical protein
MTMRIIAIRQRKPGRCSKATAAKTTIPAAPTKKAIAWKPWSVE